MKILCLHPWGTSGLIFEKQLATLTDMLGPTHEYVYINGHIPCARAQALPDFVKGPYYCWYEGLSTAQCQEAHDIIAETIKEEGPIDGVIGFSQGASLALSFILHHELHKPGVPCPFKFALFFCANLVISPDPKFNLDMVFKYSQDHKPADHGLRPAAKADDLDKMAREAQAAEGDHEGRGQNGDRHEIPAAVSGAKPNGPTKKRALLVHPDRKEALFDELTRLINEMLNNVPGQVDAERHSWPKDPKPEDFPRLMHPLTVRARVPIPSVHIIAEADPLMGHAEAAARLCDKEKTKLVYFMGGHRIPTAPTTLRTITSAVEWAMQKSQLM